MAVSAVRSLQKVCSEDERIDDCAWCCTGKRTEAERATSFGLDVTAGKRAEPEDIDLLDTLLRIDPWGELRVDPDVTEELALDCFAKKHVLPGIAENGCCFFNPSTSGLDNKFGKGNCETFPCQTTLSWLPRSFCDVEQHWFCDSEGGRDSKFGNGMWAASWPETGDFPLDNAVPRCRLLTEMLVRRQPPNPVGSSDKHEGAPLTEIDPELFDEFPADRTLPYTRWGD